MIRRSIIERNIKSYKQFQERSDHDTKEAQKERKSSWGVVRKGRMCFVWMEERRVLRRVKGKE